jgi:hypothetical protein
MINKGKRRCCRRNLLQGYSITHILRRNCFLKLITLWKTKGNRRRRRRRVQLLHDVTKKIRYWNLKEEALGRAPWRTHFGPAARQATHWIRFEVLTAINTRVTFLWNMTQCSLVNTFQYCKTNFCLRSYIITCSWRQQVIPKIRYLST